MMIPYYLQLAVDSYFEQNLLSHIAVRIGRRDSVLMQLTKGKEAAVNEYTLFDMASVTKIVVTTSLALIAMDRDMLHPENAVSDYLPIKCDWKIKHLLTHTCGLGYRLMINESASYDTIAQTIVSYPQDIPTGTDVLYSCPAFILLGKILEKLFSQRLDKAFEKWVAHPLYMTETGYLPQGINIVNSTDCLTSGTVADKNCRFLGGIAGNAGLFSNLNDMERYVQMLFRRGQPLFSEKTFDVAIQNHTPGMSEARGYGYLLVDERYSQTGKLFPAGSFGHCGHTGQSVFVDLKSGLYVIILSDATVCSQKKYGTEHYDEVIKMREVLHNAIKADLEALNKE